MHKKDELIILGSGGGRHHVRTQYRATGGLLFKFNNTQAHIDPGPGAIVRLNQYNEDPTKTELFIATHLHLDHTGDMGAIIESSRESLYDKNKKFFKKGTLITTSDTLPVISKYHLNMLENIIEFKAGNCLRFKNAKIIGTKVMHSNNEGFGIRFNFDSYSIAYSSDTTIFDGFAKQFNGVNILILNLLRPDSVSCKRHLATDQVLPYLKKIDPIPNAIILNHFGVYMDSPLSKKNYIPSQVEKIKKFTNIEKIIAAEDGLRLKIDDILD
ncbi:MAG: hypothetical protein KGD63_03790 [Candidatus Lokiarchaeota archaeon]|nr:hypothetical protein [Candidatus Lokiarchaeota archaeon]